MNRILLPIIFILCFTGSIPVIEANSPVDGTFSADEILADVRAHLPQEFLLISGDISVRKRKGIVTDTYNFEIIYSLGTRPQTAQYTIRDGFGNDLERLAIIRNSANSEASFEYTKGSDLASAPLPDLFGYIQNTDISWTDLTLSFLWWQGGRVTGTEMLRGQSCYVLEVPAQRNLFENKQTDTGYSKVVLWIEKNLHMILQAEGRDCRGNPVSCLRVQSFKKNNGRWMIKEMEVESFPSNHRTRIQIQEVGTADKHDSNQQLSGTEDVKSGVSLPGM